MEDFLEEEDGQFCIENVEARHEALAAQEKLDEEEARRENGQAGPYPESDWEAIIEAVLFTMGNSVELGQLAAAIGQCEGIAEQVTERLAKRYEEENRGMQIIALENSYQMTTKARFYENLIRVAATPKKQVLTDVVMETLSIVAYRQPVTKAEISRIRGVSSDHAVNRLVEYGLIEEVGRMDAPGRPALFATTEEFLRRFGVGSTSDLPTINPEQEEEIAREVQEEMKLRGEFPDTEETEEDLTESPGKRKETENGENNPDQISE